MCADQPSSLWEQACPRIQAKPVLLPVARDEVADEDGGYAERLRKWNRPKRIPSRDKLHAFPSSCMLQVSAYDVRYQ